MNIEELGKVTTDDELANLGFKCLGRLDDITSDEDKFERLWLWGNDVNDHVVTVDQGNGYCFVKLVADKQESR